MKTARLTKYQFKICEAVHLGLDYYYMGPRDRRLLKQEDYEVAQRLLPTLPEGWYTERYDWMTMKF